MTKLIFGRLNYIIEKPLEFNLGLRIECSEIIPSHLFKYYSPSEYNLKSLFESKLYFSHPYRFNDITDSTPLSFDYKDLKIDDYARIFEDRFKKAELERMYENEKLGGFSAYRILLYSLWTQKIGLFSLSKNEMNDLMWGHYSTDSGFKVKFDTVKLIDSLNKNYDQKSMVFPINYINQKLQVDVGRYGVHLPLLVDFSTKVKSWEYEDEWRIIMTKNDMDIPNSIKTPNQKDHKGKDDRLFKYDPSCISEIVLGMDFFNGINLRKSEYVSPTERVIISKDNSLSLFLDFIVENFPDKIYHAGVFVNRDKSEFEGTSTMGRSIEQINIQKIDDNKFMLKRINPDSVRQF